MTYRKMDNDELIDVLFTAEDAMPRAAANEIVRRADELTHELADIVMDRLLWTTELPDWWAPIHATYLLGAIGTEATFTPLLAALRWSDAYDNEWVAEDLPAIFGSLGKPMLKRLERVVADRSAGWTARGIAMDSMAAIALREPELEEEAVRMIAAILDDPQELLGARRSAAVVLLDLKRTDCKAALIKLASEEEERFKGEPDFAGALTVKSVESDLAAAHRDTSYYLRDWMSFYDPDEIRKRRERWAKEEERYRLHPRMHAEKGRHETLEWERHARLEDPCPCGSGKRYRRCCWQKIH